MTNEELLKLIQQARGTLTEPVTGIDRVVPLPIGSKTLIGFLGALLTGAVSVASAQPQLLDFSRGDWKSSLATLLAMGFTALAGAGGISKWQRHIIIAQQGVEVLQQVLSRLQEMQEPQRG